MDVGWCCGAADGTIDEEFDEEPFALLLLAGCGAPIYCVGGWLV